jgi:hypothetical protein
LRETKGKRKGNPGRPGKNKRLEGNKARTQEREKRGN